MNLFQLKCEKQQPKRSVSAVTERKRSLRHCTALHSGCCFGIFFIILTFLSFPALFGEDTAPPEDRRPLFEKPPFNRLTLTSFYNSAVFDILPVDRPTPFPTNQLDTLTIRFVGNPDKEFQIKWTFIAKIDIFSELVRDEFLERLKVLAGDVRSSSPDAADWPAFSNRFELMFDYIRYLEEHRDELPDFSATYQKFLFEEAAFRVKSQDFLTGLARYETLFKDNRDFPGLEKAWSKTTENILERESRDDNFAKCRQLLNRFREFYPEGDVVKKWSLRLDEKTKQLCDESQQAAEEEKFLVAHRLCEKALRISPDSDEVVDWQKRLQQRAPRLDIAVTAPSRRSVLRHNDGGPPDWADRRAARIFDAMLCRFVRPTLQGGEYSSSLGTVTRRDTDSVQKLHWTLSSEHQEIYRRKIYDITETVLSLARSSSNFRRVVASVDPIDAETVEVRLRRSFLIPEAFFTVPVRSMWSPFKISEEDGGFYSWDLSEDQINGFRLRMPVESHRPPSVIFEHTILRGEEAVEQLRTGTVDMIDRVPPWMLDSFKSDRNFTMGRYAIPTLYFIVPNLNKPLTKSRTFRRSLLYGLNRQGMLGKLAGKEGQGTVLSAPIVRGASLTDPLGYAYDTSIAPRPYEPKLAIALSLLAFNQVRTREPDWNDVAAMPELVLARPKNETSEFLALMICRQWAAMGISVRTVEYRDDEPIGRDDSIDFWLVDRAMTEPLIDVERILGTDGLAGAASPYMELALEKLRAAEDWPTAGRCLQAVHRLCFEETTIIPLWQITEHYVHRIGIEGIEPPTGLLDFYQNVLEWTITK